MQEDFQTQSEAMPQDGKSGLAKITLEVLGWLGAVLLPLPAAILVSIINRWSAKLYIGPEVNDSLLFAIYDSCLQGYVMAWCAYFFAPRKKFYSSSIISTVYVTLSFTSIVVWLFMRPFDLGQFIRYVATPIGIILGIVSVSTKRERDS